MNNTEHTCSYSCDRPECIKAQRDELYVNLQAVELRLKVALEDVDSLQAENNRLMRELDIKKQHASMMKAMIKAVIE